MYIGLSNNHDAASLYKDNTEKVRLSLTHDLMTSSRLTEALAPDYSIWDEPYEYLKGNRPGYIEDNLVESVLTTFDSDAMWMFHADGRLAGKINIVEGTEGEVDFDAIRKEIAALFKMGPRVHFYAKTKHGIMDIYGSRVSKGEDTQQTGPSPGYLLTGRLLNDMSLKELEDSRMTSVRFLTPQQLKEQPSQLPVAQGVLVITVPFKNIRGEHIGSVYALYKDEAIPVLHRSDITLFWVSGLTFATLLTSMLLFAWLSILRPVRLLYESLETGDTANLKKMSSKNTEFGQMALLITKFFEQQDVLRKDMQDKGQMLQELEAKSEELERTNEAMIGRELRMIELKKQIKELQDKQEKKS
jgi:hypothetical protein